MKVLVVVVLMVVVVVVMVVGMEGFRDGQICVVMTAGIKE